MQFGTGDVADQLIPSSEASKLAEKKNQVTKVLRDAQASKPEGMLQQMMMQHFKETTNHHFYYSLPVSSVKALPIKQMATASTSMLSIQGKAAQPSGMLPVMEEFHSLPLEDRVKPIQDQPEFLQPISDVSATATDMVESQFDEDLLGLAELVDFCQHDGLLVFKVTDVTPHRKKRPLGSVDNIVSADLAIRPYKICKCEGQLLWAMPTSNVEVPLLQIFAGKEPEMIIKDMWSWTLRSGDDNGQFVLARVRPAFQQRVACPLSFIAVDIKKNKPTAFELYLKLKEDGWTWKKWSGKAADLKRVVVNLNSQSGTKTYYGAGFHYMLCLVCFPKVASRLKNTRFLFHGQSEAYYIAAFLLGQQRRYKDVEGLLPNKPAKYYRTESDSTGMHSFLWEWQQDLSLNSCLLWCTHQSAGMFLNVIYCSYICKGLAGWFQYYHILPLSM